MQRDATVAAGEVDEVEPHHAIPYAHTHARPSRLGTHPPHQH
jgi:hypothetical protein